MQVLRSQNYRHFGVVAPRSGCGTTFTAINLACGLARVENFRTMLVDLNQRAPAIHRQLDIEWNAPISDLLLGRVSSARYLRKISETLGVALNAVSSPTAADVLHGATAAETLLDMSLSLDTDVMIYDLPPMLEYDDLSAFAPNLDAVLLVANGTQTTAADILACEKQLAGRVPLLGVVLNEASRT